jgi:hypothetical protein
MKCSSTRFSKIALCLAAIAALGFPLIALGDEFVGPPPPPANDTAFGEKFVGPLPAPLPVDKANAFDKPRDYISGEFVDFVASVDRFFGNDRNYQEANDSVLQIDLIRVIGYGGGQSFVPSARANVRLPIAEKKLHLILETDPDKNATVNPTQTQSPPLKQPSTPRSYAAALRIEKTESERWHYSADAGLQMAGINSKPFARTRASLAVPMGFWRAKVAETLFWFHATGVGESTILDMERPISDPLLLRATSSATWLRDTKNFDMRQDISVFQTLDDRTKLLYQASVIGVSRPRAQVTDCVLLVLYRYRIHREWTFLEVSPQLHFPIERNYHASPMLSMRLEMLFDESK